MGTWHDPGRGWPIAAPLERCAELLGVDLASLRGAAAKVEPYLRADGTQIWSLMQLERQPPPGAYRRRRAGYLDRRRIPAADAEDRPELVKAHDVPGGPQTYQGSPSGSA